MSNKGSTLTLTTPKGFDLTPAVCSYGYYMLAPNRWDAKRLVLHRPLHGRNDRIIHTATSQPGSGTLRITCDQKIDRDEAAAIRAAIARIVRLSEDFTPWHCAHPKAKKAKFGPLFRSPTLYEDVIKTMTVCNVSWPNSKRMNVLMCEHFGRGAFPTPGELARVQPEQLKRLCKVGYRAERIIRFARQVHEGELDLAWFEHPDRTTPELFDALRGIYGLGPYAAGNLCQLLGRYDCLAIDSETYRHFREYHKIDTTRLKQAKLHRMIEQYYEKFRPYQFLAYWFELWGAYQDRLGD